MKGYEIPAPEPFEDNDGKVRDMIRTTWWKDADPPVLRDDFRVFGARKIFEGQPTSITVALVLG